MSLSQLCRRRPGRGQHMRVPERAKEELLEAIGEAMAENGRVIVTGCLGVEPERIRAAHPGVLAVTGPHQYEAVVAAVHEAAPPAARSLSRPVPPQGVKLTPRHYAYLKISEGCNNRCSFCIIPACAASSEPRPMPTCCARPRGWSPPACKELLVISQDTLAYGLDIGYAASAWADEDQRRASSTLPGSARSAPGCAALRLSLSACRRGPAADGGGARSCPISTSPSSMPRPKVLKAMRRPAHQEKTLGAPPPLARNLPRPCHPLHLHRRLSRRDGGGFRDSARLAGRGRIARVGCFKYEPVEGAAANALPGQVPEEVKAERWNRFMAAQQAISGELFRAGSARLSR